MQKLHDDEVVVGKVVHDHGSHRPHRNLGLNFPVSLKTKFAMDFDSHRFDVINISLV